MQIEKDISFPIIGSEMEGRRSSDMFKDSYIKSDYSYDEPLLKEDERVTGEEEAINENIHDSDYVVVSPIQCNKDETDRLPSIPHLLTKGSEEYIYSLKDDDEFFAGYSIKKEEPEKSKTLDKTPETVGQENSYDAEPLEDEFFAGRTVSTNESISAFKSNALDQENDVEVGEPSNEEFLIDQDTETVPLKIDDYLNKLAEEKSDNSSDEKHEDKKDLFEDEFFAGISIKSENVPIDVLYNKSIVTEEEYLPEKPTETSEHKDDLKESKAVHAINDTYPIQHEQTRISISDSEESSFSEKEFFSGVSIKKSPDEEDVQVQFDESTDKKLQDIERKAVSTAEYEFLTSIPVSPEQSANEKINPITLDIEKTAGGKLDENNKIIESLKNVGEICVGKDIIEQENISNLTVHGKTDKQKEYIADYEIKKLNLDHNTLQEQTEITSNVIESPSKDILDLQVEDIYPTTDVPLSSLTDFVQQSLSRMSSSEKNMNKTSHIDEGEHKNESSNINDRDYHSLEMFAEQESKNIFKSFLESTTKTEDSQTQYIEETEDKDFIPQSSECIGEYGDVDYTAYNDSYEQKSYDEDKEKSLLPGEIKKLEEFAEHESKQIVDKCFDPSKSTEFSNKVLEEVVHELKKETEISSPNDMVEIPGEKRHMFSDTVTSKIEDVHISEKPFIAEETSRAVEDITSQLLTELEDIDEKEKEIEKDTEPESGIMNKSFIMQEAENIVGNIMSSIKLEDKILDDIIDAVKSENVSHAYLPITSQEVVLKEDLVDKELEKQNISLNEDEIKESSLTTDSIYSHESEDESKLEESFEFIESPDIPHFDEFKHPQQVKLEHLEQSKEILRESLLDEMALIGRKLSFSKTGEPIVESEDVTIKYDDGDENAKEGKIHASYLAKEKVPFIFENEEVEKPDIEEENVSIFIVDSEDVSDETEIPKYQEDMTTLIVDEAVQQAYSNILDDVSKYFDSEKVIKEEATTPSPTKITHLSREDNESKLFSDNITVDSHQMVNEEPEDDFLTRDIPYESVSRVEEHQEVPEDPMISSIFIQQEDKIIFEKDNSKVHSSATSSPNPFMTEEELKEYKTFLLTDSESVDDLSGGNGRTKMDEFIYQKGDPEILLTDGEALVKERGVGLPSTLVQDIEEDEKLLFDDLDDDIPNKQQLIEISDSEEEGDSKDEGKLDLFGLESQSMKLSKSHSTGISTDVESPQTVIDKFEELEKDLAFEKEDDEVRKSTPVSENIMKKSIDSLNEQEITPSTDSGSNIIDNFVIDDKSLERRVSASSDRNNHFTRPKTHQSYDNVSESSLQEFERLEAEIFKKSGDVSPSSDDSEGGKSRISDDRAGSRNSLNEFERLEKELADPPNESNEVMMLSYIREESEYEDMSIKEDEENVDSLNDNSSENQRQSENDNKNVEDENLIVADSLEQIPQIPSILETSIDSLEVSNVYCIDDDETNQEHESKYEDEFDREPRSIGGTIIEARAIPSSEALDNDSLLGFSSSNQTEDSNTYTSQNTEDTFQEYHEDDKDSLEGDLTIVGGNVPTTITTFKSTKISPAGNTEVISRRVLTKVTDPIICRVKFTGTESEERLKSLNPNMSVETTDAEGNVTTTVKHEQSKQ
uniref:Reticulon-like protein n=1 Tax=Strongyloides venezuelensis TaxID=75913 RepID=A0A0K0F2K5_STRVS